MCKKFIGGTSVTVFVVCKWGQSGHAPPSLPPSLPHSPSPPSLSLPPFLPPLSLPPPSLSPSPSLPLSLSPPSLSLSLPPPHPLPLPPLLARRKVVKCLLVVKLVCAVFNSITLQSGSSYCVIISLSAKWALQYKKQVVILYKNVWHLHLVWWGHVATCRPHGLEGEGNQNHHTPLQ